MQPHSLALPRQIVQHTPIAAVHPRGRLTAFWAGRGEGNRDQFEHNRAFGIADLLDSDEIRVRIQTLWIHIQRIGC